jgi:hypothetical protein
MLKVLVPARLQALRPLRIGVAIGAHVDRGRRALEHVQVLRRRTDVRHALDRGRARADHGHALAAQAGEIPLGVAAGVGVVPAARVEGVPAVRLDPQNARQLGAVQRAVRHDDEAGAHAVAAVGGDDPAGRGVVPAHRGHFGLEAGVAVQIVLATDRGAVREDLGRARVLLFGDVAHLFQERQVDVRLDVALRAGVAVPVPGAAEVAALLDQAQVVEAALAQARAGE